MTLNLARKFRIYTVNVFARPNLSDGLVLNITDDSYGKWMYEMLSRFGVRNAFLVGISLGGFVALKFLAFDEKRIAKAFLITPAGIVNRNPLLFFLKVTLPLNRYRATRNKKYLNRFLEKIYSEQDEFSEAVITNVLLHFKVDLSLAPLIAKREARRIKTPLYIFAAEKDLMFPFNRMKKRIKRLFPALKVAVLFLGSNHVLSLASYGEIAAYIRKTSIINTFKTK